MRKPTRRQFLSAAAALPLVGIRSSRAGAAEFRMKFATGQDPSHPVNKRAQEAIDRIRTATGGRVEINLFPANQLGPDTDLISQLRFGAVDYLNIAGVVLATLVPRAGIVNTGFAFPDYEAVWKAVDGAFGTYVKSEIEAAGLLQPCKAWNNGFQPAHDDGARGPHSGRPQGAQDARAREEVSRCPRRPSARFASA